MQTFMQSILTPLGWLPYRKKGRNPNQLPDERLEDEASEEPDSDDEKVVEDTDWKPTDQQLRDIKIVHDSAGHPTNADFARLLR